MAAAVPLVAAAAGAATTAAGVFGTSLFGYTFLATAANSFAGYLVSTAVNMVGSRTVGKKASKAQGSSDFGGRSVMIRSSVESHKIIYGQMRVSGPMAMAKTVDVGPLSTGASYTEENLFLHLVLPLAGHEVEEIGDIYLADQVVTFDPVTGFATSAPYSYAPLSRSMVRVKKYLGGDDQLADQDLISECQLTADFRLRGIAYVYVRFEWQPNVFVNGIPNVSAVVKGKKVYDPRTDTTAWTDNSALCIRDYLTSRDSAGYPYGFGCDDDEINDDYFEAAANICDESVTLLDGSTQARFTCNGVVDTAAAPLDNLQSLVTSLAGAVTYVQGKFRCHAAAYDSPVGSIDETILAGKITVQVRPSRKEVFNAVKGTYVDPNRAWQATDFPIISNSTFESQDGGERIVKDIDLPFTNHGEAAQRIAKIIQRKARQGLIVEMPVMLHALKYAVWDVLQVTNEQQRWEDKPFRIIKWSMAAPGPIMLTLQEESSDSYDWTASEATEVDAAPDTNLPSPWDVSPPGVPSVTEELYETRDSAGVKARATVTYARSPNTFVRRYITEYQPVGASTWTVLPVTDNTSIEIPDIAPGRYIFRTKAVTHLFAESEYATAEPVEIFGLSAPPSDVTGLTMQTVSSLGVLKWNQQPELDVRIGGRILIRHTEDTASPSWENSYSIGEELGNATFSLVPLKAGVYMVKAQDSSGLNSANAATVETKNASVLTFSSLSSIQEDSTFSGTHSGTVAESGVLTLGGSGMFDDIPDLDAVVDLDYYGGVSSTGTYTFASGTNNGSVKKVRVETSIELTTANVLDLFDSRTGDVDDWLDFDGAEGGGSVDCYVEARETDDDPTGSPTWGEWKRVDAADFEAWGIQYRAILTSDDPAYAPQVTRLRVTVKEVT